MDEKIREAEERVKFIFNDCWFVWKEYTQSHDMAQVNRRVSELKKKYDNDELLIGILYELSKTIRKFHVMYLMGKDGRL